MLLAQFYLDRGLTLNIYLGDPLVRWQWVLADKHVGLILLGPVGDNAVVKLDAEDAYLLEEGREEDVTGVGVSLHSLILQEVVLLLVVANRHVDRVPSLLKSPLHLTVSAHVHKTNLTSYLSVEGHPRTAAEVCRVAVHSPSALSKTIDLPIKTYV